MGEVTEKLASFAAKTQFTDIPPELVNEIKNAFLDSIGCAVAGLSSERGTIAAKLAKRLGGQPESTVIGTGDRVSCTNAAYANAELINALDFDPMCASHNFPPVAAASLAVAESLQSPGKDLILALALGFETVARVFSAQPGMLKAVAQGPDKGKLIWGSVQGFATSTIGAAASSSKLLNLNQETIANAIGTAAYLAMPNTLRKFSENSPAQMSKYGMFGWGAQGGVTAALLAQMGFEGDTDAFEGEYGFWRFTGFQEWKTNVFADLGTKWNQKITIKQYPCRYPGAGAVDNFIKIIEENKLQPADIEKVRALLDPFINGYRVVRENSLKTSEDFSFNIPYAIACAAHRIHPTRWLDVETRRDPSVLEFVKKVEIWCDEKETGLSLIDPAGHPPHYEAEVVAKGKTFKSTSLHRKGEPRAGFRLSKEEVTEKFMNNVSKVLKPDKASKIVQTVLDLENLKNVAEIGKMVTP